MRRHKSSSPSISSCSSETEGKEAREKPRAELALELLEGGAPLSLARSTWASHKSDALGGRGTIELGSCLVIHLCGLELAEKLIHGQSLIACRLNDLVHLEISHRAVKCVEQLEGLLMLCVLNGISRSVHIDFVHNRLKPTEHVANALTRPLCEVLIFTPVSLE